jgi:hypothetical protein
MDDRKNGGTGWFREMGEIWAFCSFRVDGDGMGWTLIYKEPIDSVPFSN